MMNNAFEITRDGKRFAVTMDGVCYSRFDDKANAELYISKYDTLKTLAEFNENERDFIKRLDSYVAGLQDEYGYEFHEWSETVPWMQKAICDDIYLVFGKGNSTVSVWVMLKDGKVNVRFTSTKITVKHFPEGPEVKAA